MITIKKFTVNPFQENSYVVSDESGQCAIIDPGYSNAGEEHLLNSYISSHQLKPVLLLNTHCHIDHIMGNRFVSDTYRLGLHMHRDDLYNLKAGPNVAALYGIPYHPSPEATRYLKEGETISFGNSHYKILLLPGHSKGSIGLWNESEKVIFSGDVLFFESIGRTDLPGGNMEELELSIRRKVFTLPDDTTVYSGHGPETTIGHEKRNNPFVRPE